MTLFIPKDVLDFKIMCLYNNPKGTNLISATSLSIIAFQKFKCIRVFFSEVLSPEKKISQYYCSMLLLYIQWYIIVLYCSILLLEMAVIQSTPCSWNLLCTYGGSSNTKGTLICTCWEKLIIN